MHSPKAEALCDAHGSLLYAEIAATVSRWAGAIAAAGIGVGDRIAMLAPPGRESLICLLASDMPGSIWAGLDLRLRAEEITFRLGDLTPALVLSFETLDKRHIPGDMLAAMRGAELHAPLVLIAEHADAPPDAHPGPSA